MVRNAFGRIRVVIGKNKSGSTNDDDNKQAYRISVHVPQTSPIQSYAQGGPDPTHSL
jgi:hypothetical protein